MFSNLALIALIIWFAVSRNESPLAKLGLAKSKTHADHITHLIKYMRQFSVTPAELSAAWDVVPAPTEPKRRLSGHDIVTRVMFVLGGLFVLSGLSVYATMFWDSLSSFMRILLTLGVGMGLTLVAVSALKEGKYQQAILPLILIAAGAQCGGWFVFMHEMFPHGNDWRKAAVVCFGIMAVQQSLIFNSFRKDVLAFTAVAFTYATLEVAFDLLGFKDEHIALILGGSLFFTASVLHRTPHQALCGVAFFIASIWFSAGMFETIYLLSRYSFAAISTGASIFGLSYYLKQNGYARLFHLGLFVGICTFYSGLFSEVANQFSDSLAAIITGLSVCGLAYGLKRDEMPSLSEFAIFVGSAMIYCGFFDEVAHGPLETTFPLVAIGMMYASGIVQSPSMLITAVLAILGFIGYYTTQYFIHSAGWPIALMIMGIAFLAVGSMAIRIKRNYLK